MQAGDERLRGVDIVTYHDGEAAYYGLTPNDHCDFRWVLGMPLETPLHAKAGQAGYWYDVRRGRYLGAGDGFSSSLERGSTTLVARLPYAVSGLQIEGPDSEKVGEAAAFSLRVQARGAAPGRHVIHCDVRGPDGALRPHYAGNLIAPAGEATFTIPLALNDPPGQWRLACRDVATGTRAARRFTVASE